MADSRRHTRTLAAALAAGLGLAGAAMTGVAPAEELKTLRGNLGLQDINPAPKMLKQQLPGGRFGRAFRQQPPLIPHAIDGFQVTRDFNQCMSCHDVPASIKGGPPKPPATHYTDRDGKRLDKISGARFFCTECHVPQADAKPLVANTFRNADRVK